MEQVSDRQAVQRVLQGDKEAYGILLERYKNLVYRTALNSLGDCDQAEDVVQETFLRAYQNLERLHNPDLFGFWLSGIARNICRNIHRDQKNALVSMDHLKDVELAEIPQENPFNKTELVQALRKAILLIPDKYREILELRYMEGYSCEGIASFCQLSQGAVLVRLYRARKQLMKILKKEGWL
jgi:RNA polymerase sigma-70 factor (ECF subfamily)